VNINFYSNKECVLKYVERKYRYIAIDNMLTVKIIKDRKRTSMYCIVNQNEVDKLFKQQKSYTRFFFLLIFY